MNPPQRIYLVGMPGSGKSTVGAALAKALDWQWFETDACVERQSCMAIEDIFTRYGEAEFRRREHACLRKTLMMKQAVISCGGGTPCFYDAMDLMLSSGKVIYLKATVETLVGRLEGDEVMRPLLSGSLNEKLLELYEVRKEMYDKADARVETDGMGVEEVVRNVTLKVPLFGRND